MLAINEPKFDIKVLDKGFVRYVDHMGNDNRIVQAARVSYGAGTKTKREDEKLIRYLMKNKHTSPLEKVIFEFHMKLPIFIARQVIRHRTASVNEISGRYSVMEPEFYIPKVERIQAQSKKNKQCSGDPLPLDVAEKIIEDLEKEQVYLYNRYQEKINLGLSRELARINLPFALYTEWYWTMDLHNLFGFLRQRLHSHAQWEVQEYAKAIAEIVKNICPVAYKAFEDYQLNTKEK